MIKKHCLFKAKIKKEQKEIQQYTLYLGNLSGQNDEMFKICHSLRMAGPEDILTIRINSGGGKLSQAHTFINVCNDKFADRVTTIIDYSASSAAATIFLCGRRRIIYPHSTIMFHGYRATHKGSGQSLELFVRVMQSNYKRFRKKYLSPYFTPKEIKELLNNKEFRFGAKEMGSRRIATHVMYNGELRKIKKARQREDA